MSDAVEGCYACGSIDSRITVTCYVCGRGTTQEPLVVCAMKTINTDGPLPPPADVLKDAADRELDAINQATLAGVLMERERIVRILSAVVENPILLHVLLERLKGK